jgi:hypothetical protein
MKWKNKLSIVDVLWQQSEISIITAKFNSSSDIDFNPRSALTNWE